MHIEKFTFNPFQENTYVLSHNNKAIVFDPGCFNAAEQKILTDYLESNELELVGLWATHCHLDHVFGAEALMDKYKLPFCIPEKDVFTYEMAPKSAAFFGIPDFQVPEADASIKPGQYQFQGINYEIRFTPGHSVGHVVFVFHEQKMVIAGDVLFDGSIGRTDLPGGDFDTLATSIKTQLYTLPDDYTVYCGHGPETTIGKEKSTNPFVSA
ncbi:MBL fold metallo-hydrolase [Luteibaculum oceani]|uniref:MBL fold metallo-hydrolase n=1 Tax=Luteibaculum oceani TaxID=1294296 RepID=A0A5C6V9D2_9FLAO|nr:MBL fold metallo-hydrolase [Luteibaculum oceani]TXC81789.1 MBL fold metallo-hydrolase [Luteibaculum oceani]